MLIDGAIIMVIGTGTVFAFLGMLVCMISLIAFLVNLLPTTNTNAIATGVGKLSSDNFKGEEIAIAIAIAKAFAEGEQQ